jgi:predicted HAD superfamily Cof-like phosphohydrolase
MCHYISALIKNNQAGPALTNFERVKRFMKVMGQATPKRPQLVDDKTWELRKKLIEEEYQELLDAWEVKDIVEIADALTDLLYVIYGAQVAFGINGDECFEEVDNSNMTKITPEGEVLRNEHGKVIKPPSYRPPNLLRVLADQLFRQG